MNAPNLNCPALGFYRDEHGWHTDRNWNAHPATAEELESTLVALQALHCIGLQVVHHVARRHIAIVDNLDPVDELAAAQCLVQLHELVWPAASEHKEVPNDGAG